MDGHPPAWAAELPDGLKDYIASAWDVELPESTGSSDSSSSSDDDDSSSSSSSSGPSETNSSGDDDSSNSSDDSSSDDSSDNSGGDEDGAAGMLNPSVLASVVGAVGVLAVAVAL